MMSNGAGRLVGAATAGLVKDSVQRWVNSIVQTDAANPKAHTDGGVDGRSATDLAAAAADLAAAAAVSAKSVFSEAAAEDYTAVTAASAGVLSTNEEIGGGSCQQDLDDLTLGADAKCLSGAEAGIATDATLGDISAAGEEDMRKKAKLTLPPLLMTDRVGGGSYYSDTGRGGSYSAAEILRQRFGNQQQDSFVSDCSHLTNDSVSSLLDRRREDPEQILENMGFGGADDTSVRRIPDRFLQNESKAVGITVERYLEENPELKAYWEEKSARENPFEIVFNQSASQETGSGGGSSPRPPASPGTDFYNIAQRMTLVNKFKNLAQRARAGNDLRAIPTAEPVLRVTSNGRMYWSILAAENCHYLEHMGYYDVMNYRLPKSDQGRIKVVVDQFKSLAKSTAPRSCSSQSNLAGTSKDDSLSTDVGNSLGLPGFARNTPNSADKNEIGSKDRIGNSVESMDKFNSIERSITGSNTQTCQGVSDLDISHPTSSLVTADFSNNLNTNVDTTLDRTNCKASSPVRLKFKQKCLEKFLIKNKKSDDTTDDSDTIKGGMGVKTDSRVGGVLQVPGDSQGSQGRGLVGRRCPSDGNLNLRGFSSSTDESDSPVARRGFHPFSRSRDHTPTGPRHKDVNDNRVPSICVGKATVNRRRPRARSSDPIRTQRSTSSSNVPLSEAESDWTARSSSEAESIDYEWQRTSSGSTATTTDDDDDDDDHRWSQYTTKMSGGKPQSFDLHFNVGSTQTRNSNLYDMGRTSKIRIGNSHNVGEISSTGDGNDVGFSRGDDGSSAWIPEEVGEDREGCLLAVPGISDTASNASSSRTLLHDGDRLSDVEVVTATGDAAVVAGVTRGRRIGSEDSGGGRDSFERTPSFRCTRDFSASLEEDSDNRNIVIEPATPDDEEDERGLAGRGQEMGGQKFSPPSRLGPRRGVLEVMQSFDFEEIESQTDSIPSIADRKKGALRRDEVGSVESDSSGFADTDVADGSLPRCADHSSNHDAAHTGSNQLNPAKRCRHGDELLPGNRVVSLRRQLARSATEELEVIGGEEDAGVGVRGRPLSATQLNQTGGTDWNISTGISGRTAATAASNGHGTSVGGTEAWSASAHNDEEDIFSPVSTYRTSLYVDSRSSSMPRVPLEPGEAEVMLFVGGGRGSGRPTHEVRMGPPASPRGLHSLTSLDTSVDSMDSVPQMIRFCSIDVEVEDFKDGRQQLKPVAYTTGERQKSFEPWRKKTGTTASLPASLNSVPRRTGSVQGTTFRSQDTMTGVPSARRRGSVQWEGLKMNVTDHVILYNLLSRSLYASPQALSSLTHPLSWSRGEAPTMKELRMSALVEEVELFQQALMKYKAEIRSLKLRSQSLCSHCNLTASSTLPEDRQNISALVDIQRDISRQCVDLDLAISQKMRDTVADCIAEDQEVSSRSLANLGAISLMIQLLREQTYHSNIVSGVSTLVLPPTSRHSREPDSASMVRFPAPTRTDYHYRREPHSASMIRNPAHLSFSEADCDEIFTHFDGRASDHDEMVRYPAPKMTSSAPTRGYSWGGTRGSVTSPLPPPTSASATTLLDRFNSLEQKFEELRTSTASVPGTLQQFQDSLVEEIRQLRPSNSSS